MVSVYHFEGELYTDNLKKEIILKEARLAASPSVPSGVRSLVQRIFEKPLDVPDGGADGTPSVTVLDQRAGRFEVDQGPL